MQRHVAAALALGAILSTQPAFAQMRWEGRGFANIGFGAQAGSRDLATTAEPIIYDEPASITSAQTVGSGAVFDISGGWRVWRNLVVGLGYSRFSDSSSSTVNALIPHPLFFDQPRSASATVGGLDHTENAVHIVATWMIPVTDKIEVGLFAGPSFFSVSQDVVSDVSFTEGPPPFTSVTLGTPVIANLDDSAVGANVGVQLTYLLGRFTGRPYGINGFMRYAGASAEFDEIDGGDLSVGGFQIGVGLQMKF